MSRSKEEVVTTAGRAMACTDAHRTRIICQREHVTCNCRLSSIMNSPQAGFELFPHPVECVVHCHINPFSVYGHRAAEANQPPTQAPSEEVPTRHDTHADHDLTTTPRAAHETTLDRRAPRHRRTSCARERKPPTPSAASRHCEMRRCTGCVWPSDQRRVVC